MDEQENEISEEAFPYGYFMRGSPMKSVTILGEKNNNNRAEIRKSLFERDKDELNRQAGEKSKDGETAKEVEERHGFADIMNSLQRVRVGDEANADEKGMMNWDNRREKRRQESPSKETIPQLPKHNIPHPTATILHPTTKTQEHKGVSRPPQKQAQYLPTKNIPELSQQQATQSTNIYSPKSLD